MFLTVALVAHALQSAERVEPAMSAPRAASAVSARETGEQSKAVIMKECGAGFEVSETAHWLIVHKADPKWVGSSGRMLERTHDFYFDQFNKAGLEPQALGQRLICVLIGKQEDFVKYLEAVPKADGRPPRAEPAAADQAPGARRAPKGLGSYSAQSNRIQLCDIHSIPRNPAKAVDAAKLDWENVARITHEGAHQLSFNTGILRQRMGYPMWLGEGLACNFEFSDADKPFGPLTDNLSPRAARLGQLLADGKIASLKSIVTMSPSAAHQPDNKGPTYVQGWGLFRFLITERPKQLKAYLKSYAGRSRPPANGTQALAAFEAAFGPVKDLESDWQAFLKRFGPLESGRRTSAGPDVAPTDP